MSEKQKRLIHLIYGIVLSALIITVAVCLIVSCIRIYQSGDRPFTRSAIQVQFQSIAVPVYVCLGVIVGGFFLQLVLPIGEKERFRVTNEQRLEHMKKRFDVTTIDTETAKKIQREQKVRFYATCGSIVLCVLCCVPALIYLFNGSNFTVEHLNNDIFKAIGVVMIASVGMLAVGVLRTVIASLSVARELELIKSLGKLNPPKKSEVAFVWKEQGITIVRAVILAVALALVMIGIFNGGAQDVLAKAVRICTECIGLG